ncbi:MAG: dTDP-4-dehydrorhamnose reductase [Bacteroidia bacterium]|nr:MAG: dTDP-4-dehydrorhamnose reductase [Bacteroidia bacterium]
MQEQKKILVFGADGQLGTAIMQLSTHFPAYDITGKTIEDLDLTNFEAVEQTLATEKPHLIINCAAYTAVDNAETDKKTCFEINVYAIENIAKICKKQNIFLVHISSDYVFEGKNYKPYLESDSVKPIGVYAQSKLLGEQAILSVKPKSIIIRTSWLYSFTGKNFVKTMLKLGKERNELSVVFDQIGSPTYAPDLAKAILNIAGKLNKQKAEIYHFSNEGVTSWYDFAKEIIMLSGRDCKILPIETKDFPTPATRPHFSVLNKKKIKNEFEIEIPHWKDSLILCLEKLKET